MRVCNTCHGTGVVKGLHNWIGGGTREEKCWACHEVPVEAQQPAQSAARPVTPYTCPKCHALWLHWPAEQSSVGHDSLECSSIENCIHCEKGGLDLLRRLERVPATLTAPTPQAASSAVLKAIRAANMQLVRTGDDEFMLVTYKNAKAQCDGGQCGIGGYCDDCPTPQADSQPAPIDMVLHCPKCGLQHIDRPDGVEDGADWNDPEIAWKNPPHRSHLCHGCGHIWRPADVPTNGVKAVKTTGKADSPIAARAPAESVTAPAGGVVSAPVFAFRRKGLDDFCTCTEERYAELSAKPNLFETRIFYTTPPAQAADSVLEDAARLERERICAAIKAEDDYCVEHGDYMLDSDDCIKIVRGEWVRPDFTVDAARKKGANHD